MKNILIWFVATVIFGALFWLLISGKVHLVNPNHKILMLVGLLVMLGVSAHRFFHHASRSHLKRDNIV